MINSYNYISMDLGTANTLAYVKGQGIVFNEPSLIAYDVKKQVPIAHGNEAYELIGKTHRGIRLVSPLKEGVIADFEAVKHLIAHVFSKLKIMNVWKNAIVLLACPSNITGLEKKALIDIAKGFGARDVFVEEEVKMAALGAGIDIKTPQGNLCIDIGGGTTDIAILAAGDIVVSGSVKIAGNYLTKEVEKHVRQKHNITIGRRTATQIKHEIGSLVKYPEEKQIVVYGRDVITGMPKETKVSPSEIREIFLEAMPQIVDLVASILEKTPPELSGDILRNGVTLVGGGALIKGIDKFLNHVLGLPVRISENPLMGIINGTRKFEQDIVAAAKEQRKRKSW